MDYIVNPTSVGHVKECFDSSHHSENCLHKTLSLNANGRLFTNGQEFILKVLDLPVDNVLQSLYRNTNYKVFEQH